jgi:hypothetical protein
VFRVGAESVLDVSRGVGVSGGGMRINCPPEIHLLRLVAPSVEVMVGLTARAREVLVLPAAQEAWGE